MFILIVQGLLIAFIVVSLLIGAFVMVRSGYRQLVKMLGKLGLSEGVAGLIAMYALLYDPKLIIIVTLVYLLQERKVKH